jgi:predicted DNA binding CopG/RHH family protein
MLETMQQPATSTPSPSFAGVLASFATPGQKRPPLRDLDFLEDDVATLSYERALRTHSRYRSAVGDDHVIPIASEGEQTRIFEAFPAEETPVVRMAATTEPARPARDAEDVLAQSGFTACARNLKSASITIRLSKTECAQLRNRAAEAGMTVSAYLRSCSLEAESLRAMVRDTMAKMRTEAERDRRAEDEAGPRVWFSWLRRLWPRGRADHQVARA